jgi:hypothetical protein
MLQLAILATKTFIDDYFVVDFICAWILTCTNTYVYLFVFLTHKLFLVPMLLWTNFRLPTYYLPFGITSMLSKLEYHISLAAFTLIKLNYW